MRHARGCVPPAPTTASPRQPQRTCTFKTSSARTWLSVTSMGVTADISGWMRSAIPRFDMAAGQSTGTRGLGTAASAKGGRHRTHGRVRLRLCTVGMVVCTAPSCVCVTVDNACRLWPYTRPADVFVLGDHCLSAAWGLVVARARANDTPLKQQSQASEDRKSQPSVLLCTSHTTPPWSAIDICPSHMSLTTLLAPSAVEAAMP